MQRSGNAYKVRLLLAQLGEAARVVDVDILRGDNRTPDFLMKNPDGRVPLLELPGGRYLPESNAILFYLAEGTPFLPDDRIARAEVLRWMFFEQHSHEPYLAQPRFWLTMLKGGADLKRDQIEEWMERGYQALGVMEKHLAGARWFGAERYTIADVALYAHTHVAHEGGFDLTGYPKVRAWLKRVAGVDRHVTIDWRPEGVLVAT
jgi:glutathione S-transferase